MMGFTLDASVSRHVQGPLILLVMLTVALVQGAFGQGAQVRGFVSDAANGEALVPVNIILRRRTRRPARCSNRQ